MCVVGVWEKDASAIPTCASQSVARESGQVQRNWGQQTRLVVMTRMSCLSEVPGPVFRSFLFQFDSFSMICLASTLAEQSQAFATKTNIYGSIGFQ